MEKSFEWFKRAAEQGHEEAQYNLAVCYENGDGVEKDLQMAIEWYTKSAEQDDEVKKTLSSFDASSVGKK